MANWDMDFIWYSYSILDSLDSPTQVSSLHNHWWLLDIHTGIALILLWRIYFLFFHGSGQYTPKKLPGVLGGHFIFVKIPPTWKGGFLVLIPTHGEWFRDFMLAPTLTSYTPWSLYLYSTFQFHYNVHLMLYDEWSPNIGYARTIVEPGGTCLVPCPRPLILGPPPLEGLTQQLFLFQSGIKCWVVPKEWEVLEVSACPPRDAYLWNFPRSTGVTSWKKWHNLFFNFKLQWAFWGKKKCLLQYAFHFSKQALLAHNLLHFGSVRVYLQIH
jgi:hypothetical protein